MKDASKWRALPDTVPEIEHGALIGARKLRKSCHKAPARYADSGRVAVAESLRGRAQAGTHFGTGVSPSEDVAALRSG